MDQFLTYKKGNLGPVFNFTAYMLYNYFNFFFFLAGATQS